MPTMRKRLMGVLFPITVSLAVAGVPTAAAPAAAGTGSGHRSGPAPGSHWFDEQSAASFTVQDGRFVDGLGREVVLRGYNVSGETKLEENGGLPFASVADAEKSAQALRTLGGGNAVRFLLFLAFTYEDRSRDGSTTLTWNPVPPSLPRVRELVGSGQYGLLLWRSDATPAPTELHLPASFEPARTTVVSDLGTVHGPPSYGNGTPIAVAPEPGGTGSRRLILTAPQTGGLHYALITNGSTAPSEDLLRGARDELSAWAATRR